MKRTLWGLALVSVLLAAGSFSAAQEPAAQEPATDDSRVGGTVEARILVKQLEAQVESQRAALRQTEANLEQARALLTILEGGNPNEKKVAELRAVAEGLERKLKYLRRVTRVPGDPAVVVLTRKLASVQREIEELKSK